MPDERNRETGSQKDEIKNRLLTIGKRIWSVTWRLYVATGLISLIRSYREVRRILGHDGTMWMLWRILAGESKGHFFASIGLGLILGIIMYRRKLKQKRKAEEEAEKEEERKETLSGGAETPAEEEYIPPTYRTFGS